MKLTPTFADTHALNGAGGPVHIIASHEPTREGEKPPLPGATPIEPVPATVVAPMAPPPLKIALVGTAPSSRMLAPFGDPSWQIWACSPGNMNSLPRVDMWFELHSNLLWPEHEAYGKPYIAWLKDQKFPVMMQDRSMIPHAQVYPMTEMVEEFGSDFFTSSFAWMMAFAMRCGAAEIALYGIDMASRDEYIRQRPGFYYFRHVAERRGIVVSAPHESDIMQSPPLYAYVDSTPFGRKILARRQEVNGRITQMSGQRDQVVHNITYLQGALEDLDYFESIWSGVSNESNLLRIKNIRLEAELAETRGRLAAVEAVLAGMTPPPMIEAPVRKRRARKPKIETIEPAAVDPPPAP